MANSGGRPSSGSDPQPMRLRNFARATKHLHVVPSTLDRTIRSLERRLDVVLLNRTTRRYRDRLRSRFAPAMKEMEAVLDAYDGQTQPRLVARMLRKELPDVILDLSGNASSAEASATG